MNRYMKQTLLAPALLLLAATLGTTGCQSDDDALSHLSQGSVPLVVGDVTVAGAQTAAGTRAAITEDPATGYTGIRKSSFVDGDALTLTLTDDGGMTTKDVTATLTGSAWVLTPANVFITPGTTEISATHTATEQKPGIATDDLAAANADCTLTDGELVISMKHAGAMIDITPAAGGATITSITVNGTLPTVPEEEAGLVIYYRTLTAVGTELKSITAVIAGKTYVATLAAPVTLAANKRYPVKLTFEKETLTATVSAPQAWTDGGTIIPTGYTRIIDSPEALAQFAFDMAAGGSSKGVVAIQVADLDMSQLKLAGGAGTNPLTGSNYSYTATKDTWMPIGRGGAPFQGSYNGNGHTISNLKGGSLFNDLYGAKITGIHLRNVQIVGVESSVATSHAPLASDCQASSIVTLCSATGSVNINSTTSISVGGLIANCSSSVITRCSADVDVTVNVEGNNAAAAGGLIGKCNGNVVIAGCMASGDVNLTKGNSDSGAGGLVGLYTSSGNNTLLGCLATGNITAVVNGGALMAGRTMGGSGTVSACFATGTVTGVSSDFSSTYLNGITFTDCAYTQTQTTATAGIEGNVTVNALYGKITEGNASTTASIKTLHWSEAEGYTLTEVSRTWYATDVWKNNGTTAPTLDMTYEGYDGPLYNGAKPNLLAIAGQTAYYVAPVDASTGTLWTDIDFSTICPDGWHVPTQDEFRAMTGIMTSGVFVNTNHAEIKAAFPENKYWSSSGPSSSYIWFLEVTSSGSKLASALDTSHHVRCVRTK